MSCTELLVHTHSTDHSIIAIADMLGEGNEPHGPEILSKHPFIQVTLSFLPH